jgi:hypothetical protein
VTKHGEDKGIRKRSVLKSAKTESVITVQCLWVGDVLLSAVLRCSVRNFRKDL